MLIKNKFFKLLANYFIISKNILTNEQSNVNILAKLEWTPETEHIGLGGHLYRIRTGFIYLAAILDAFSRKVIGYAVSTSLDTALTFQALNMAMAARTPGIGIIHHSDQGV